MTRLKGDGRVRRKISIKIFSLVAVLIITGLVSNLLSSYSLVNMNEKAQAISTDCLNAVSILAETARSVERVQKFANNSMNSGESGTVTQSGETSYRENMNEEAASLEDMFTQLEEIVNKFNDAEITAALDDYKAAYQAYTSSVTQAFGEDGTDAAQGQTPQMNEGMEEASTNLDTTYSNLNDLIYKQVDTANEHLNTQYELSSNINTALFIFLVLIGIVIILVTLFTIIKPIKEANEQLNLIIDEIDQGKAIW